MIQPVITKSEAFSPRMRKKSKNSANVGGDGQRVLRRQAALTRNHLLHIGAIDEAHDKVEQPRARLAEVMHWNDRRMLQLCNDLGLVLKPSRESVSFHRPHGHLAGKNRSEAEMASRRLPEGRMKCGNARAPLMACL